MPDVPQRLRAVVIGAGAGIFGQHQVPFTSGLLDLVGVADVNAARASVIADQFGCETRTNPAELVAVTQPDLAVIITPHVWHAPIARQCLAAGVHVLVEKPLALEIAEADELIDVAAAQDRLVAVCLQHRLRPEIQEAKRLIDEGSLGVIQRVQVTQAWTRTHAYYTASPWRGTWRGEGGGATLTLAIHHLDLLYYLFGIPARVTGWTRTLLHPAETEDTVHTLLEWDDGLLGFLHVGTGESGAAERIEIVGTSGTLMLGEQSLTLRRFANDLREHARTDPDPFAVLPTQDPELKTFSAPPGHLGIYENVIAAIQRRAPVIADGREGRVSLELANAIIYASYLRRGVELPLDPVEYSAFLRERIASAA